MSCPRCTWLACSTTTSWALLSTMKPPKRYCGKGTQLQLPVFPSGLNLRWWQVHVLQVHDSSTGPFSHHMLQLAKLQLAPTIIYTSSKAAQDFIKALQKPCILNSFERTDSHLSSIKLCLERSSVFQWQSAVRSLQQIQIGGCLDASGTMQPISAASIVTSKETEKVVQIHKPTSLIGDLMYSSD